MNSMYDLFWKRFLLEKGLTGRNANAFFEDFFQDIVLAIKPELVVEIGAFEAGFSQALRKITSEPEILAFEANPHAHSKHVQDMPKSIEYKNNLVSSDQRPRSLFIPRRIENHKVERDLGMVNKMSSMLVHNHSKQNDEIVFERPETVDNIISAKNKTNVALWIDVEGAAGEVLFGAKNSLSSGHISAVFVELEVTQSWSGQWVSTDVRKLLSSYGLEPICRDDEAANQFNEIYVHSSYIEQISECFGNYVSDLVRAA